MLLLFSGLFLFSSLVSFLIYFFHRKFQKAKSLFFYSGLVYLIMGFPLILSFLVFAGIFLLLIGVIFVYLGKRQEKTILGKKGVQWGIVLSPMVGLFLFLLYWEAPFVSVLVPEGYTGRILIVHSCSVSDHPGLVEPAESESIYKRIYRIPPHGVLHTEFSYNGTFDMNRIQFYYVDSQGKRSPIPQYRGGYYEEKIDKKWKSPRVFYGFLSNPDSTNKHPIMNFIIEKEVHPPHSYKKEEIPEWIEKIKLCE